MSVTATKAQTLQTELDKASPNSLADVLAQVKLGTMLTPLKVTVAGLGATAAIDITTLPAAGGVATVNQGPAFPAGAKLPPILSVTTLRVTAVGGGALGPRVVTDAGGAAGAPGANGPGIALLSDDGKTLTFEGTVTGFVIEYVPRAALDMGTLYPSTN